MGSWIPAGALCADRAGEEATGAHSASEESGIMTHGQLRVVGWGVAVATSVVLWLVLVLSVTAVVTAVVDAWG